MCLLENKMMLIVIKNVSVLFKSVTFINISQVDNEVKLKEAQTINAPVYYSNVYIGDNSSFGVS